MLTSYNDISSQAKLINYTESQFRVETWFLDNTTYECVWLPQNEGIFPTTIYYKTQ